MAFRLTIWRNNGLESGCALPARGTDTLPKRTPGKVREHAASDQTRMPAPRSLAWPATEGASAHASLHLCVLKIASKVQGLKAHQAIAQCLEAAARNRRSVHCLLWRSTLPSAYLQAHGQQWPQGQQAHCRGTGRAGKQ